jgi:hypothetical protein
MNDDELIAEYLGRLVLAARPLPPDRRADLIDEIAEHIEQARTAGETSGSGLADLLIRLGEPEAIVAAASDSAGDYPGLYAQPTAVLTWPPAVRESRRKRWLDPTAVLLVLGSVLLAAISFLFALIGWAAGIAMLLQSPRWPVRAKVLGAVTGTLTMVLFGGLLDTLAMNWLHAHAHRKPGPFGWQPSGGVFVSVILVVGAVVAVTLVGARLLRYPLVESRPATPGQLTANGPASPASPGSPTSPEPAAPAPAIR